MIESLIPRGWIDDYEAMPDTLRLYLDMFIAILPRQASMGATTNDIKVLCESNWGLYYPKTVWYVALDRAGFTLSPPVKYANGVTVNVPKSFISGTRAKNSRDYLGNRLYLPDLYKEWDQARGMSGYNG